MSIVIIACIVGLVAVWVFFFLAKRAVRMFVRLTLAVVLLVIMCVGALAWWWHGWSGSTTPTPQRREIRSEPASRRAH